MSICNDEPTFLLIRMWEATSLVMSKPHLLMASTRCLDRFSPEHAHNSSNLSTSYFVYVGGLN